MSEISSEGMGHDIHVVVSFAANKMVAISVTTHARVQKPTINELVVLTSKNLFIGQSLRRFEIAGHVSANYIVPYD